MIRLNSTTVLNMYSKIDIDITKDKMIWRQYNDDGAWVLTNHIFKTKSFFIEHGLEFRLFHDLLLSVDAINSINSIIMRSTSLEFYRRRNKNWRGVV